MAARSREDAYIPSNGVQRPLAPLAASALGDAGDFVMILNPGTTGTITHGANTANAKLAGVATQPFDQAAGDTEVVTDIDGPCVWVTHGGGNQAVTQQGKIVYVSGKNTVADSGNVVAGRIVHADGTARVLVQCVRLAHVDISA